MTTVVHKKPRDKKLVKNHTPVRHGNQVSPGQLTKKGSRHTAEPYLRPHQVKGKSYYYYCRGTDKEIYLGDAAAILKAVRKDKGGTGPGPATWGQG